MKRVFDLVASGVGLIVLAPVIAVLMIAIRLDSPGPALFRQTRIGRQERPFTCLKLRTMPRGTPDAPSHEMKAIAMTPLGRFLRRSKLDELPQLWNIVTGEMSLVGPRPCLPSQTELIAERRARGLYALRPGITGPAQLAGIDMSDPVRLADADHAYLRRMSVGSDLRMIVKTAIGGGSGDRLRDD